MKVPAHIYTLVYIALMNGTAFTLFSNDTDVIVCIVESIM